MTNDTLDIHQAAELLKVHFKTVLDMINDGDIPAARVGRAYVMLKRDVLQHIEDQIIAQTAERLSAASHTRRRKEVTTLRRPGRTRAGSRSASSSGGTYAR